MKSGLNFFRQLNLFILPPQYLSSLDVDGNGLLTFSELMTSLHAVTPKTKAGGAGAYAQGFSKRAGVSSGGGASGYPPALGYGSKSPGKGVSYSTTWDLTEHYDGVSRKQYLLDVKTGLLYSDVPASDWPTLVAQLVPPASSRDRERIEPIDNYAATSDFFNSLDQYLKQQKVGGEG